MDIVPIDQGKDCPQLDLLVTIEEHQSLLFQRQGTLPSYWTTSCAATATSPLWPDLYNIRKIRPFLTRDPAQILVQALITTRLDYCNSAWLDSLPQQSINPPTHPKRSSLPRVQILP